jgi:DNA-binding transcriptional MerR regulator
MQAETQDWSIGQLARYSGLSVKTVRFYTDAGLLISNRSAAGHRRYGPTDLVRLTLIRGLRSLDIGLDTIGQLLAGVTDLQHCLRVQEHVLQLRLLTVRRQLAVCRAAAQDTAGRQGDRLLALTRIEAAERDRLLEGFWNQVLGSPENPVNAEMRTAGTPELPPEPTTEQVDAWLELTELAADPDFRNATRRTANWFPEHSAATYNPAQWAGQMNAVCTFAEPLIADGVNPDDLAARPAAALFAQAYAAAFDRPDNEEFRCWLSEELQQATDPRAARWWQLIAIIQPPPDTDHAGQARSAAHHRRATTISWLTAALQASILASSALEGL